MICFELEVGDSQVSGPRIGLYVVEQVILVSIHEGEDFRHQCFDVGLCLPGETLPHTFAILRVEHLLVFGIDLFFFHIDIPEELINIHVILCVAIMFGKTSQTALTSTCSTSSIDTHELYRLLFVVGLMTTHFLTNG